MCQTSKTLSLEIRLEPKSSRKTSKFDPGGKFVRDFKQFNLGGYNDKANQDEDFWGVKKPTTSARIEPHS